MNKLFKSAALIAASLLLTVNFSSCNKDPQDNTEEANKAQKEAIVKQYLNHTVYPTYANLAEQTEKLVDNLETLKEKFGLRVFATPKKMGAQTAEANINAGLAAARQIVDYFATGNTKFQVNK